MDAIKKILPTSRTDSCHMDVRSLYYGAAIYIPTCNSEIYRYKPDSSCNSISESRMWIWAVPSGPSLSFIVGTD